MLLKKNKKNRRTILLISFIIVFVIIIAIVTFFLLYIPDIKLNGDNDITISYDEKYKESGYHADIFGINVDDRVIINNNINYHKTGNYEIEYKTKNFFGKSKIIKRKVTIIDQEKPLIELVGEDVTIYEGDEYKEPGYSANDEFDGDISEKVVINSNLNNNVIGEYLLTYEVEDSSGNKDIKNRKVFVREKNVTSVPIITYHQFMADNEKMIYASDDKYTMSISSFEQQLKYLSDNGYKSVSLDDFYSWYIGEKMLTKKDIVITIDDGNVSAYKYAIPLLEKYGFQATIFVITGRITDDDLFWDPSIQKYFSYDIINDIKENHKSIMLASHTHKLHQKINNGCALNSKNEEQIYKDVLFSKSIIQSDFIAYPYGCHTNTSDKAVKRAGYKMGFEFGDNKRATRDNDIYGIKRLNVNANISMNQFIKWLEV